ncbi:hypothetical protein VTO42DRAFT_2694 [Malbranchea cinnamomea]
MPPLQLGLSPQGVALCVLAMLSLLVCIPPLIWHTRNGNLPIACLSVWLIVLNFFNFANAIIWPTDDIASWWDGQVYCDIHAKLYVGVGVGLAGALVCVFRSLAKVLDTDRPSLIPRKREKQLNFTFEIAFCVVIPVIQMIVHYVVQDRRYFIVGIVGCRPAWYQSWVSVAVGHVWPPVILIVATIYCIIVIYRLCKYKRELSCLLSSNTQTTKTRFVRLFLMSLVMLLGSFPTQLYVLYSNIVDFQPWYPYSWDLVHSPEWGNIEKYPAFGVVNFDRWIHVTAGFLMFAFFGFGHDATLVYRSILLKLGFGRLFPSLKHPHIYGQRQGSSSSSTRLDSFGNRAKTLFRKLSSTGSDMTVTRNTTATSKSVAAATSYDSPYLPRPFILSAKPLPKIPGREFVTQYPHLEVWPPSPSESTLSAEPRQGRTVSSEASTVINARSSSSQDNHHPQHGSGRGFGPRGDEMV